MQYDAHIRKTEDGTFTNQSVRDHCRNTAAHTSACLERVKLSKAGYLAGLLHDAGKNTQQFEAYMTAVANGEQRRRGSVNHTFCAVRMILENWHDDPEKEAYLVSEVLSYACGAHHGLFDCVDENEKTALCIA